MFNIRNLLKLGIGTLAAGALLVSHAAGIAQSPPTQSPVFPNLMLIFDDSGSMTAQALYQYGGAAGGYGMTGPGGSVDLASCANPMDIDTPCVYLPKSGIPALFSSTTNYGYGAKVTSPLNGKYYSCVRSNKNGGCPATSTDPSASALWNVYTLTGVTYHELSPDVNRLYYDPRIKYAVRIKSNGTLTTPANVGTYAGSNFYVYFYKDGSGNSRVWNGSSTNPSPTLLTSYFSSYNNAAITTASGLPPPDVDASLAPGANTTLAYPQCVGACVGGSGPFPKFANRTDCAGTSCSLAEEMQNYANWKKFHATRLDMTKTGLGYAFSYIIDNIRMGWSLFSDLGNTGSGAGTPVTSLGTDGSGVGVFNQARKDAFYTWLYSRDATADTPTRESLIAIGKYFMREDNKGPWANDADLDPTSKSLSTTALSGTDTAAKRNAHASCRRSFSLLTTDGYYNDYDPAFEDTDATSISTFTDTNKAGAAVTYSYNGSIKPYAKVSPTTSLADIALKYWITDLRNGTYALANKVPQIPSTGAVLINTPSSGHNESFWQNMGFYAVGLGINGTLPQTTTTLANLTAGNPTPRVDGTSAPGWPDPPSGGNSNTTIDDIWHATINGRGRYLNAATSDDLQKGVEGMLAEITRVTTSQAGVAASAAALTTNTRKYTPMYTTGSWSGDVIATKLDASSAADVCVIWRVTGPAPGTGEVPPACTSTQSPANGGFTTNGIPAYGARNIYAWNGSGGTKYGSFNASNSYVTGLVGTDTKLIDFLRGDRSNEDVTVNGTVTTRKLFRTRDSVMGDIVSSTPSFIGSAKDMGYASLPVSTATGYTAFVASKAARAEGMLFAGANDGMLHGFRDSNGAEAFAFVPRAVMSNLPQLAGQGASNIYNHRYYVDGTTTEVDACLTGAACSTWTNMLLGSLGAGGKEIYAIDVTTLTPSSTMGMSAANVMWEITTTDITNSSGITTTSAYANLGHTLSDIKTGILTDGTWVAVFGNGYYGADATGHLYVANLKTGALIKDISTGVAGTGSVAASNGLSPISLVYDSYNRIIGAYAGDLMGNMWKFDLSSGTSASCCKGLAGSPLYAASSAKPITAPPYITAMPSTNPPPTNVGRVVTFGTGKLFDTGDAATTTTQSFYGIWDDVGFGNPMPSNTATVVQVEANRSTNLVQQTLTSAIIGSYISTSSSGATSTVAITGYKQSNNTVDWTTKRGWYLDMPDSGERMVAPMTSSGIGRFITAYSVAPSSTTGNVCTQAQSGSAWDYTFNPIDGSRPSNSIYPGCLDCSRVSIPQGPIGPPVVICNSTKCYGLPPTNICNSADPTCNTSPLYKQKFCGGNSGVACATTSVKRTWRKLMMR